MWVEKETCGSVASNGPCAMWVASETHSLGLGFFPRKLPLPFCCTPASAALGSSLLRDRLRRQHVTLAIRGTRTFMATSVCWLGPATLALYCGLDMCLSYTAATLAAYGPPKWQREGSSAADWWWRVVDLLYGGVPPAVPGTSLLLEIARPACLLIAMQLFRYVRAQRDQTQRSYLLFLAVFQMKSWREIYAQTTKNNLMSSVFIYTLSFRPTPRFLLPFIVLM